MRFLVGAVGVESVPAYWDLSSRPHGLIVGQTGSGKSFLARLLIDQAVNSADVWVADGKAGGDFVDLLTTRLALGPEDTVTMVEDAADVLHDRMIGLRPGDRSFPHRPLLVVADELAAVQLRRRGEDSKAQRERRDRLQGALGEIALLGRAADVHLLALLQRPDTDSIPGAVRDQLGLRIALGWMSNDGYRMIFGAGDMQPPPCLDPGNGWISGHERHRDGPRLLRVANSETNGLNGRGHRMRGGQR